MGELLSVRDLLKVAVEDERSGVAFYGHLAGTASSGRLREVFADLASQEQYHLQRFQQMLDSLGLPQPPEQYAGEYSAYLRALTGGRAFPDAQAATEQARSCPSDAAALDLARRFERDTLVLLGELGSLLPASASAAVAEVVKEEQSHLVTLEQAARDLKS